MSPWGRSTVAVSHVPAAQFGALNLYIIWPATLTTHSRFPVVQSCSETLTILPEERVRVINSTVNIQQRILRLYDLIENDL